MRKAKWFGILLLFTYSISLVHDFIPHFHHELDHSGFSLDYSTQNLAISHNHTKKEDHSPNVIAHESHKDASILDFVICLFESVKHGSTGNNTIPSDASSSVNLNTGFVAVLPNTLSIYNYLSIQSTELKVKVYHSENDSFHLLELLKHDLILRGPPTIS